jgi:hypothetical protein
MLEYSDQEVNNDIVHLQVQFLIDLFLILHKKWENYKENSY